MTHALELRRPDRPRGRLVEAEPLADYVDRILRDLREGNLSRPDALSDRLRQLLDHLKGGPLPL